MRSRRMVTITDASNPARSLKFETLLRALTTTGFCPEIVVMVSTIVWRTWGGILLPSRWRPMFTLMTILSRRGCDIGFFRPFSLASLARTCSS